MAGSDTYARSTKGAVIDKSYHWIPIDHNTPTGEKLQLIHRDDGNAMYGIHKKGDNRWTHWAPAPTFKD